MVFSKIFYIWCKGSPCSSTLKRRLHFRRLHSRLHLDLSKEEVVSPAIFLLGLPTEDIQFVNFPSVNGCSIYSPKKFNRTEWSLSSSHIVIVRETKVSCTALCNSIPITSWHGFSRGQSSFLPLGKLYQAPSSERIFVYSLVNTLLWAKHSLLYTLLFILLWLLQFFSKLWFCLLLSQSVTSTIVGRRKGRQLEWI